MVESNPDEYIAIYPDTSNIELGEQRGFMIYDFGNDVNNQCKFYRNYSL